MKSIYIFLGLFLIVSCSEKPQEKQKIIVSGFAQGTTYNIIYISEDGKNYQRAIDSTLIEIDNSLSTYQKKSLITKFNQSDSIIKTDKFLSDVFLLSTKVFDETDGAFDPSIAPLVNFWGFGFATNVNIDTTKIDSLRNLVSLNNLVLDAPILLKKNKEIQLDFNAIAQGYTVDVLGELLEQKNIQNYLVEVGGELKAKGVNMQDTLWRVGIDKPIPDIKEREIEAIIHLQDKALATSGNYRKFYEKDGKKYSHTINPKTGYPVEHNLLSATVVADECSYADAYATAFMVMGVEKSKEFLKKHKELEALLIYSDEKGNMQSFVTQGLKSQIELNPNNK